MRRRSAARCFGALLWLGACGSSIPVTRHFALALTSAPRPTGQSRLVIEELESDVVYQERRMIYRDSPFRLDFDPYNRWSVEPRLLVTAFLRRAYVERGYFAEANERLRDEDVLVLSGKLLAFEELSYRPGGHVAHAELALALRTRAGGAIRWDKRVRREVRMERAEPEGLAKAMSQLLTEVVDETGPELLRLATTATSLAARPR